MEEQAAITIQRAFRGFKARRDYSALLRQRHAPEKFYQKLYKYREGTAILSLSLESAFLKGGQVPQLVHVKVYNQAQRKMVFNCAFQIGDFFFQKERPSKQEVLERAKAVIDAI